MPKTEPSKGLKNRMDDAYFEITTPDGKTRTFGGETTKSQAGKIQK